MRRRRSPGGLAVALLVDALYVNGAVKITVDLARRWARDGAQLVVLKRIPPSDSMRLPEGIRARVLAPSASVRGLAGLEVLLRLVGIARRSAAIVVGSEIGVGLVLGFLAARIARVPFVIAIHADLDDALDEWMPRRWHPFLRAIHRRADAVICVEEALVGPVVANGLPADRVSVVTNGVDVDVVRLAAAGPDPLPEITGPIVVATGRLAPQKATDVLLRAHAEVVRDLPHRVLLLNDGPDEEALEALAAELGVAGSVVFAGRVPPHPVVKRADLFALPSKHEGLPLSLLEAMALGTPALATESSAGVRAALDDGRAGDLVPVGDLAAFTAALRAHLADPAPLRRMAAHGLEHLRHFDIDAMAGGWAAAIRRVTAA